MKNLIFLTPFFLINCSNKKNNSEYPKDKTLANTITELRIGNPIQLISENSEILETKAEPMKYGESVGDEDKSDRAVNYSQWGKPNGKEDVPSADLIEEIKFVEILNKERKRKGLSKLEIDKNLCRAARYHSYDMGIQKYFEHASYDRNDNGELEKVCGTFERTRVFGSCNAENIAAGGNNAERTYEQWFNSPGHNRNMFDKSWTRIGVGYVKVEDSPYTHYWTTDFGY